MKADDLLDRLVDKALAEVRKRNPDFTDDDARRTAEEIAVAAVRYFMVKFSRTKIIVFDIDEALSFEGESGPYLQYAAVRAGNIFTKLRDREQAGRGGHRRGDRHLAERGDRERRGGRRAVGPGAGLWTARRGRGGAVRTLEPSVLAKYAFGLAQAFSAFYHRCPILSEERADVRLWRAAAASYFRQQMARALDLMGATVPGRM